MPTDQRGRNRCGYVLRQAGQDWRGRPVSLDGHGDTTEQCGTFGRAVPHTFWIKKPGTTAVYEPLEGTVIRCAKHAEE